jgi:1,6-anhydro-N-acetylmuramate kinase
MVEDLVRCGTRALEADGGGAHAHALLARAADLLNGSPVQLAQVLSPNLV